MPITIQNSAGGGVTLDSTTSSNETLQLPSGGGTLAPLASPSFTGTVSANKGSAGTLANFTDGVNTDFIVKTTSLVATAGPNAGSTSLALQTAGSERMRIDSSGNVLVGTTSAFSHSGINPLLTIEKSAGIGVRGIGSSDSGYTTIPAADHNYYAGFFLNSSGTGVGNIFVTGSSTAYNTSSDYRLKEDDVPMTGATERVKALRPINFAWKVDGSRVDGFFAHELAEVVPEAATGTKDAMMDEEYEVSPAVLDDEGNETTAAVMGTRSVPDMQGIDQSKLVPLLTATIQELIARIEALEAG